MAAHHYHAIVWIDHREARIFHFNLDESEELVLHPENPTRHIHHKANAIGSGHAVVDQKYLEAVAESVADAGAVLIAGPGSAKTELAAHMRSHEPLLARAIVGVETVDHPSDAQLVALARKYMKAADRMRPQES
jgi:stalled ribosome rescue protein Dom34